MKPVTTARAMLKIRLITLLNELSIALLGTIGVTLCE
jgi:hypothetical protein